MKNILKWISVIVLILMIISNAFSSIYEVVYPWNVLAGALSSAILIWISWVDKDKQYMLLNMAVTGIYSVGFANSFL